MRIVITGHRPSKLPGGYDPQHPKNIAIRNWLKERLEEREAIHGWPYITVATGMALGVDQMMANVCIDMNTPFIAFVPCANQDKVWPAHAKQQYNIILEAAAEIVQVTHGPYTHNCMNKRNLAMRDWALKDEHSLLLAVWTGAPGGTANMIGDCRLRGMNITQMDPS